MFFYRKPPIYNYIGENSSIVRGPAFGKVMLSQYFPDTNQFIISIFLSVFDIHWQLHPVDGTIVSYHYDHTGKFELAFNYNKSKENEKTITIYQTKLSHHQIIMYQIAGTFARRIQTYCKIGENVQKGNIMGLILLGSRVDIIIPNGSKFHCFVKKNDFINGSNTQLGLLL